MGWYALDSVKDGVEETKDFLFPVDWILWSKIAFIALFLGNIGTLPTFPGFDTDITQGDTGFGQEYATIQHQQIPQAYDVQNNIQDNLDNFLDTSPQLNVLNTTEIILIGIITALVLIVVLYLSAVFEFIFYQSLETGEVKIIEYFSENYLKGLKYFGFFVSIVAFLGLTALISIGAMEYSTLVFAIFVIFVAPLWVASFLAVFLAQNLVLPEMIKTDKGFRQAFKDVIDIARVQWKQTALFLLGKTLIGILMSVIVLLSAIFFVIVIAIPSLILGAIMFIIHPALVLLIILGALLVFAILMLYLQVPLNTFVYEYVWSVYDKLKEE